MGSRAVSFKVDPVEVNSQAARCGAGGWRTPCGELATCLFPPWAGLGT